MGFGLGVLGFGVFLLLFGVAMIRSGLRPLRDLRADFEAEKSSLERQHDAEVFRLDRDGATITPGPFHRERWNELTERARESSARATVFYGVLVAVFGAALVAGGAALISSTPKLNDGDADVVPVDRAP